MAQFLQTNIHTVLSSFLTVKIYILCISDDSGYVAIEIFQQNLLTGGAVQIRSDQMLQVASSWMHLTGK